MYTTPPTSPRAAFPMASATQAPPGFIRPAYVMFPNGAVIEIKDGVTTEIQGPTNEP